MKKILLTLIILLPTFFVYSQALLLKGKIHAKDGPLAGCSILIQPHSSSEKKLAAITEKRGDFVLEANIGDSLSFSCPGYKIQTRIVANINDLDLLLEKEDFQSPNVEPAGFTSSSVSIRNFWIGAKIGYNFDGNVNDDFFVGSATIALNLLDNNNTHHTLKA